MLKVSDGLSDSYIHALHSVERAVTLKRVSEKNEDLARSFRNLAGMAGLHPSKVALSDCEACACLCYGFKLYLVLRREVVIGVKESESFGMAMEGEVSKRLFGDAVVCIP
jgi:hypothetical protein